MYCALLWVTFIIPASAQVVRPIDLEKSQIAWEGTMLFNLNGHFGTVKFKSGQLELKNGMLIGGEFVVDMNTIVNTDGKFSQGLVDHLKNEDFFDVAKFPTAAIKISKVGAVHGDTFHLEADMEIKGITNPIEIQKVSKVSETVYRAVFIINRANWNIQYASNSFFDGLGDDVISDAIKLDVLIWLKDDKQ